MNPDQLEADAPEGWFSRYDIAVLAPDVAAIPENGLYLEVGVHKGRSLWVAKQVAKESVSVWGIDENLNPNIPDTYYIEGDSHTVRWTKQIDVLFIDADHSYEGCKADIAKYAPHVKEGGVILFHDCDETSPGVVRAVKEFVAAGKLEDAVTYSPNPQCSMARIQL